MISRRKFFASPLAIPGIVAAVAAPAMATGGLIQSKAALFGEKPSETVQTVRLKVNANVSDLLDAVDSKIARIVRQEMRDHQLKRSG